MVCASPYLFSAVILTCSNIVSNKINDITTLSSNYHRYELRKDLAVIRNYGQLLIDVAQCTPDGICCFFTSYQFMEYVVGEWDRMHILQQVCIVGM